MTAGLGIDEVSGRSRVPSPPTRTTARISALARSASARHAPPARAPDALVAQARGARGRRIERVAPVDQHVAPHRARDGGEVELAELVPLGHEHDGVGAGDRAERVVGELDAVHQVPRLVLGDRVVRDDERAGRLQPRGEHERAGLAHVVGVRLERQPEQRDPLPDERAEVLLELADHAPLLQLVDLDDGVQELEVVAASCRRAA